MYVKKKQLQKKITRGDRLVCAAAAAATHARAQTTNAPPWCRLPLRCLKKYRWFHSFIDIALKIFPSPVYCDKRLNRISSSSMIKKKRTNTDFCLRGVFKSLKPPTYPEYNLVLSFFFLTKCKKKQTPKSRVRARSLSFSTKLTKTKGRHNQSDNATTTVMHNIVKSQVGVP